MEKKLKNNILLFIIIFIIFNIISLYMLPPSYNPEGFMELSHGYKYYAKQFIEAGRFLTAFIWYFFSLIKINHDVLSVLSVLLSNLFLTLSVLEINKIFSKNIKDKLLLLISSIMIVYNPFVEELFIFEESFCIILALYLSIISVSKVIDKKYLLGFIILFLASFLYQGSITIFVPLIAIHHLYNSKRIDINTITKYILVFITTVVLSYLILIIFLSINKYSSLQAGKVDLLYNLKEIVPLFYYASSKLFNLINPVVFYLYTFFILVVSILSNKKYYYKPLIILLLCILTSIMFIIPFRSDRIYICPRMMLTYASIPGYLLMCYLLNKKSSNKILIISITYLLISFTFIFINFNYFYNSYIKSINKLKEIINLIDKHDSKINTIYYYSDTVGFKLDNINNNENKIVLGWGFYEAFNYYFKDKNYIKIIYLDNDPKIDNYLFKDDALYITINYKDMIK